MNLLELMLNERVIFPEYAQYAVQDYTGRIKFSDKKPVCNEKYCRWEDCWCLYYIDGNKRLEGWHSDIVTREKYAEAVASIPMTPAAQQETQPSPEYCASVMRQMPDSTIEQLTTDYHTKTAEAQRQQTIADEARKIADDAMLALEKAGELLGLIISINTNK